MPGVGELFVMPCLTTSGRCDILFWEGIPGGPLDVFQGIKDPNDEFYVEMTDQIREANAAAQTAVADDAKASK